MEELEIQLKAKEGMGNLLFLAHIQQPVEAEAVHTTGEMAELEGLEAVQVDILGLVEAV
jgi:hypothetical protein